MACVKELCDTDSSSSNRGPLQYESYGVCQLQYARKSQCAKTRRRSSIAFSILVIT